MKDAPVVDDEDVALAPLMGLGRSRGNSVLDERQGYAAALVNGFKTAGIVSQEGSTRREDRRVEGTPAATNEYRSCFEKVKLVRRKAERLPVEEHRRRCGRSWVDTSEEEVAAWSGTMTEFGMERQGSQAVAGAQGSRMRSVGAVRLDDLFERAGAAANTSAYAIAELAQLAHCRVGVRAFAAMKRPAALRQRVERRSRIGDGDVVRSHLAVLSLEADAKAPGALAEGGFAAFEDVADGLADFSIFESARHVADRWQAT